MPDSDEEAPPLGSDCSSDASRLSPDLASDADYLPALDRFPESAVDALEEDAAPEEHAATPPHGSMNGVHEAVVRGIPEGDVPEPAPSGEFSDQAGSMPMEGRIMALEAVMLGNMAEAATSRPAEQQAGHASPEPGAAEQLVMDEATTLDGAHKADALGMLGAENGAVQPSHAPATPVYEAAAGMKHRSPGKSEGHCSCGC